MSLADRPWLVRLSLNLGALVCRLRGEHRYHYPHGCYDTRYAYACVRCRRPDRDLDTLPSIGPDEFGYWPEGDSDDDIEREYAIASRWFSALPFPRWLP